MTTVRRWVLVTNSPLLSNAISWSELPQGSLSYNLKKSGSEKEEYFLQSKRHLGLLSSEAAGVLSRLLLSPCPAVCPHERKQEFLLGPRHGCSGVAHVSWHAQLPHVQVTPHILAFNCYSETKGKYQSFGRYSLFDFLHRGHRMQRTVHPEQLIRVILTSRVVLTALRFLYDDKDFYLLTWLRNVISFNNQEFNLFIYWAHNWLRAVLHTSQLPKLSITCFDWQTLFGKLIASKTVSFHPLPYNGHNLQKDQPEVVHRNRRIRKRKGGSGGEKGIKRIKMRIRRRKRRMRRRKRIADKRKRGREGADHFILRTLTLHNQNRQLCTR